ncbi:uncharacterized protein F5147DRAFT_651872 [Suillus discolor]|uniref:Uncharacterized protein n=1 Tax=Suillus discolor TaxID=1912936 RepID=A0A9P7F801_9AGAM|nr:uncharacterized protein F5147DRAFT_651872 [Suillus discolor]KAG2110223.1 hypothetical protein F5147DRAFT_651872 [Suillus discolor]
MLQPCHSGQNFKVQGHSINLTLQIELVGNIDESGEELASTSEATLDGNGPSALNDEAPLLPVNDDEKHKVDSITSLKELRWLEENYRARLLKEYAPDGISTWSPHQIAWNAPSPAQTEYGTKDDSGRE